MISQFYERFSRSSQNLGHFGSSKKLQTLRTQTYHISFEAGDLEIPNIQFVSKIFKFREDKSNNIFLQILKCFRKTAKFEFFAKQIISPGHPLQNDI